MKKTLAFLIIIFSFFSCNEKKSDLPSGSPKEVLSNELYHQTIERYDTIQNFEFGYAIVKKGKFGLIDHYGKEVLNCIYDTIFDFNSNSKVVQHNQKYGIISYNGDKITEVEFDSIRYKFDDEQRCFIAIQKKDKWSIFDTDNKMNTPFDFDDIANIDSHCTVVGRNGKYGIIDSIGSIAVELKYDTIYYHFEGSDISLSELNRCVGIINSHNKIVTDCNYNCEYYIIVGHREPKYEAPKNGYIRLTKFQADAQKPILYGMVECETGKEAIPFEYDDMGDYSDGLIWVEKDNKCGYIDIQNRVIIQLKYDVANNFSDGLAAVGKRDGYFNAVVGRVPNYKIGFIDKSDNVVIPFQFQPQLSSTIPEFREGLAPMGVSSSNYWGLNVGYINRKGDFVIKPIYDRAEPFVNGLGKVNRNDKEGFVNSTGEEVVPVKFDYVHFENDTLLGCSEWGGETIFYSYKKGKIKEIRKK